MTVAKLRQSCAARIAGLSGFWEAPVPFGLFGVSSVPDAVPATKAHLAFAVGVYDVPDIGERQKMTEGALVKSTVRVRMLARHTPGPSNSLKSQDEGTDRAHDVVKRLMEQSAVWPGDGGPQLLLTSLSMSIPSPGQYFVHDLTFQALHRLSLQ